MSRAGRPPAVRAAGRSCSRSSPTLFGRLWFLQVVRRRRLRSRGQRQPRARGRRARAARRGLDARGTPLVRNRTALVVSVNRSPLLREPDDGEAVLERLGRVARQARRRAARRRSARAAAEVEPPCWRGSPYQPVPVAEYAASDRAGAQQGARHRGAPRGLPRRDSAVRRRARLPAAARSPRTCSATSGRSARARSARRSTTACSPAPSSAGPGVEATYDAALRGRDGVEQLLVDHVGARHRQGAATTPPAPGDDARAVAATPEVQQVAEQALQRRGRQGARSGRRATGAACCCGRLRLGRRDGGQDRPGRRDGELPVVRPGGVRRRRVAAGVRRRSSTRSAGAPLVFRAIQGGVRAGVDVQGDLDGGRGA